MSDSIQNTPREQRQRNQQQQQVHNNALTTGLLSHLSLADLPLRPSTLTLLQQRGFEKVGEVIDSKQSGGIATFAAELNEELPAAMKILREIQDCLDSRSNDNNDNGSSENGTSGYDKLPLTPQSTGSIRLTPPPIFTASDLLLYSNNSMGNNDNNSHRHQPSHIVTFNQSMDALLGGGIALGSVTEIAGLPGVGKTQLAMQLSVNARLPRNLGGVQGQTIYVDTEGSLAPERLHRMAQALIRHARGTVQRRPPLGPLPADFSQASHILESIHVFRVHDEASQTATLYSLPHWIEQIEHQRKQQQSTTSSSSSSSSASLPVKLVIIDSIAFHYRAAPPSSLKASVSGLNSNNTTSTLSSKSPLANSTNHNTNTANSTHNSNYYAQRTQTLTHLASFLGDLARQYHVAVVCLNQMTTKYMGGGEGSAAVVQPALGESWAHAISTRILLSSSSLSVTKATLPNSSLSPPATNSIVRSCTLVKSPHLANGVALYQVTEDGIRGITTTSSSSSSSNRRNHREDDDSTPSKRVRTF